MWEVNEDDLGKDKEIAYEESVDGKVFAVASKTPLGMPASRMKGPKF